jgi:hypothetical protein
VKRSIRNAARLAVLEEQVRAMRRETKLQAREYQRRLNELNHAHEKQVADQAHYVSDDRFKGWQGEINTFRNDVSTRLAVLAGRDSGSHGARDLVMWGLMFLVALGAVVAAFYKR